MASQTIKDGLVLPNYPYNLNGAATLTSGTALTATTHYQVYAVAIPKAGNISKIGQCLGTTTVNASSTYTTTLMTLSDTNGGSTGTAYKGAAVGTSSTGLASGACEEITLGTAATAAVMGDKVAVELTYGTFTAADSMTFETVAGTSSSGIVNFPYASVSADSRSTWTHAKRAPIVWFVYDDNSVVPITGAYPITAINTLTFANNTGTADEYGIAFSLPFPATLTGCYSYAGIAGNANLIFYTGTTATETLAVDKDQFSGTSFGIVYTKFATAHPLLADTAYKVNWQPSSTTAITLLEWTVANATAMDALSGGQLFIENRFLDGAFVDTVTTKRPAMWLTFDTFSDGVSTGGGSLVNAGLITGI